MAFRISMNAWRWQCLDDQKALSRSMQAAPTARINFKIVYQYHNATQHRANSTHRANNDIFDKQRWPSLLGLIVYLSLVRLLASVFTTPISMPSSAPPSSPLTTATIQSDDLIVASVSSLSLSLPHFSFRFPTDICVFVYRIWHNSCKTAFQSWFAAWFHFVVRTNRIHAV